MQVGGPSAQAPVEEESRRGGDGYMQRCKHNVHEFESCYRPRKGHPGRGGFKMGASEDTFTPILLLVRGRIKPMQIPVQDSRKVDGQQ